MSSKIARRLKVISILAYLSMVTGLLWLIMTHRLLSARPAVIVAQAAAVFLMIAARLAFGFRSFHLAANPTAGGLVTRGPYRVIRHPIYTGVCLFTLAAVFGNLSWTSAIPGGLVLAASLTRAFCEEALLVEQYPEYAQYAKRTWRMIPYAF